MMRKKLVLAMLTIAMLNTVGTSIALASTNEQEGISVQDNENGSYSLSGDTEGYRGTEQIVIQLDKGDIYCFLSDPDKKLLKVSDVTFQQVEEIAVDISSEIAISNVIKDYHLDNEIAEDLQEMQTAAMEGRATYDEVTLYVPARNSRATSEYVGYMGETYQETVLSATGDSEYVTIRNLTGTVNNVAFLTVQGFAGIVSTPIGAAVVVKDIYGSTWQKYPTTANMKIEVSNNESKSLKYTAIRSPYDGNAFVVRALSDNGTQCFKYLSHCYNYEDIGYGHSFSYIKPFYYNLDQKAYELKYGQMGSMFTDTYDYFYLNNWQRFTSILY